MSDLYRLIWSAVFALFRSRAALHAEILFLRHQLNVLHRRSPKRVALSNIDRLVFAGLYSLVSIGVRSGPQIGIQKGPPRFAFRTISVRPVGAGRGCGDGASAG